MFIRIIKRNIVLIYLIVLIVCFISLAIKFRSSVNNAFISPDETINYTSLRTFAKTFNFKVENKYHLNDNFTIVRPRGLLPNGKFLVPAKFIGMSLYYGLAYLVIKEHVSLLTPIIGGLGLLIMYFFVLLITEEKKTALFASLLLAFFPPYFWWSRFSYLENILGSVLFFSGFYLLTYFIKKKSTISLYLASLFFSLSCGVRPDYSVLFILPLCIFFISYRKKIGIKRFIVCATIFFLSILPIFYFNKSLYGNFLMTGARFNLGWSTIVPVNIKSRSLNNFLHNMNNSFIGISNLFLFSLLGFFVLIKKHVKRYNKFGLVYFIFILISILIFSYILLAGAVPEDSIIINQSYTRYILPLYLCILPGLSILIKTFPKMVKLLIIISYLSFSVFFLSNQLKPVLLLDKSYVKTRENILKNTETNSIVFIDILDKVIYPDRQVASISLSASKDASQMVINTIINLIKYDKGAPIYIYKNSNKINFPYIEEQLQNNNILLTQTSFTPLFKVITKY